MDQLADRLAGLPRWTLAGIAVWPRAGYKCEYCDTSLIDDLGTYFWGVPYDHILPRKHYQQIVSERVTASWLQYTGTGYTNIALSCCFCNLAKGGYDVGQGVVSPDITDITELQRRELIALVRERFGPSGRKKWEAARAEYQRFREIIGIAIPPG
jgi:hypothetical protein